MASPKTKTDKKNDSVRTTVTIPSSDYAEIERIAEKKKVSVAWVIRDAVDTYLTKKDPLFR